MQKIVTLGEINDALKIAAVTAAQLADMGFAALANKPICEGLPPEESRRLRNAKLYPAESIGQIRVALAQRLAAPAPAQAICPTFAVHAGDSKVTLHFSSEAEALEFYRTAKFDAGNPGNKTPQAAPDERKDLVPGVMRCAKCEFQLVRKVLAVNLGDVFAGDSKTEPCPNGCGPLWPVTWKQYAEQAMDAAKSMADRAFAAEKEVKQLRGELSALDAPSLRAKVMSTPLGLHGTGIGDIGIAYRAGHRAALLTAADLVTATVVTTTAAAAVPDERAAFEAWFLQKGSAHQLERNESKGWYENAWANAGWAAWQACAALAATPAAVPTYIEVRECSECGHIGINDADGSKAACSKCDWQGDSPVEDKCPDCNTVGTMTAACSNCGARASLLAETTLHAEPIAPAAAAPVVLPEPVSDKDIDAAVYAQCPDFDAAHEGPSIDDMRAIVRALLATATGLPAQPIAYLRAAATLPEYGGLQIWKNDGTAFPVFGAPQAQADARDAELLTDSALLDAMEHQRIALHPEYEGPWDAEVYNDEGEPIHAGSGSTPREAIRAAIAAAKGE